MKDIKLCHPKLQDLAGKWQAICAKQGIIVEVGETFRTAAEQDALYAQGRTAPGAIVTNAKGSSYSSQHQWGIAFDFYLKMDVNKNGKVSDDAYNDSTGLFGKAAVMAKAVGLGWGGDWRSIVDKPHLYLPDWGDTPAKLIKTYGTPDKFMKTWPAQTTKPIQPAEPTIPEQPAQPTRPQEDSWIRAADGIRWWFRYKDGTFAKGGWVWMNKNLAWYLFDKEGYMLIGLQDDGTGQKYFLWTGKDENEGKCMVTDSRGALKIVSQYDFKEKKYLL